MNTAYDIKTERLHTQFFHLVCNNRKRSRFLGNEENFLSSEDPIRHNIGNRLSLPIAGRADHYLSLLLKGRPHRFCLRTVRLKCIDTFSAVLFICIFILPGHRLVQNPLHDLMVEYSFIRERLPNALIRYSKGCKAGRILFYDPFLFLFNPVSQLFHHFAIAAGRIIG